MPTKITRHSEEELTPALRYYLLTGHPAANHVCGAFNASTWRCEVNQQLPPCVGERHLEGKWRVFFMTRDEMATAWDEHASELTAEARRYGFTPAAAAMVDGELKPLDPAITAEWRRRFMAPYGRVNRKAQEAQ